MLERKPSTVRYGAKVYEAIIERVAHGEDVTSICGEPGMPARKNFYAALTRWPKLKSLYEVALLQRADALVDRGLRAVEDLLADHDVMLCADCQAAVNASKVLGARQTKKVEAALKHYQWMAERLDPRRYGSVQKHEHKHDAGSYVDVLRAAQGRIKPADPQAGGNVVSLGANNG